MYLYQPTPQALATVLSQAGDKASPVSIGKARAAAVDALLQTDADDNVRTGAAACLTALSAQLDSAAVSDLLIGE
jgi:hypothetical protein